MNAIVVYESLWGNTAEVARAVAEGLGPGARALRTDEATAADVAGADLIVAGAPVFGFKLSSPQMRDGIRKSPGRGPAPDLSCPLLLHLAGGAGAGSGWGAAFDTQVRGPFGKGAPEIARLLEAAGYAPARRAGGLRRQGPSRPAQEGRGGAGARVGRRARARRTGANRSLTPPSPALQHSAMEISRRDLRTQPRLGRGCTSGGGGMT